MATSDLDHVIERYQQAASEFAGGDPKPMQQLFSRREDVTLLDPSGGVQRGWEQVSQKQEQNALPNRAGEPSVFERIATWASATARLQDVCRVYSLLHPSRADGWSLWLVGHKPEEPRQASHSHSRATARVEGPLPSTTASQMRHGASLADGPHGLAERPGRPCAQHGRVDTRNRETAWCPGGLLRRGYAV
jgi:hypothetical protein